jgi:hypothetical protein
MVGLVPSAHAFEMIHVFVYVGKQLQQFLNDYFGCVRTGKKIK